MFGRLQEELLFVVWITTLVIENLVVTTTYVRCKSFERCDLTQKGRLLPEFEICLFCDDKSYNSPFLRYPANITSRYNAYIFNRS